MIVVRYVTGYGGLREMTLQFKPDSTLLLHEFDVAMRVDRYVPRPDKIDLQFTRLVLAQLAPSDRIRILQESLAEAMNTDQDQ